MTNDIALIELEEEIPAHCLDHIVEMNAQADLPAGLEARLAGFGGLFSDSGASRWRCYDPNTNTYACYPCTRAGFAPAAARTVDGAATDRALRSTPRAATDEYQDLWTPPDMDVIKEFCRTGGSYPASYADYTTCEENPSFDKGFTDHGFDNAIRPDGTHLDIPSTLLKIENMTVLSEDKCSELALAGAPYHKTMLCTQAKEGQGDCQGDSGGPLVAEIGGKDVQIGVVSFGYGCADPREANYYSRVSANLEWVQETMASVAAASVGKAAKRHRCVLGPC